MEIDYQSKDGGRLSAVRKDIDDINNKIKLVGDKVYLLDERLSPIPSRMGEVEYGMSSYRGQLDTLAERNNLHSARLKYLRDELDNMKLENGVLLERVKYQQTPRMEQVKTDQYPNITQRRLEPESQRRIEHESHVPFENSGGMSVSDPYTKGGFVQEPRPATNDRKCEQELKPEEPKSQNNPDYMPRRGESRSSHASSVDDNYKQEELNRRRRREIYGVHDYTAINPQLWEPLPMKGRKLPFDHKKYNHPGGFLFMRFEDSGYKVAEDALKRMQSICKNAGGYLLGGARKERIFIHELAPSPQMNWIKSRRQPYDDVLMTENAVAVFWFMKQEAASDFLESTHNNRFREPCFPTPHGYEAFYVPLLVTPPIKPYNCFLFIEFTELNKYKYKTENMSAFEGEVRKDMEDRFPGCLPMAVSALGGKKVFKSGIFVHPNSKLYICRFQTQAHVDELWRMGMIQGLRYKYDLTGPVNVYSFVIDG